MTDKIKEMVSWVKLFMGPFLAGLIMAVFLYFGVPDLSGVILSVIAIVIGAVIGVIVAEHTRRKEGSLDLS